MNSWTVLPFLGGAVHDLRGGFGEQVDRRDHRGVRSQGVERVADAVGRVGAGVADGVGAGGGEAVRVLVGQGDADAPVAGDGIGEDRAAVGSAVHEQLDGAAV